MTEPETWNGKRELLRLGCGNGGSGSASTHRTGEEVGRRHGRWEGPWLWAEPTRHIKVTVK
uniref:Uncharacterized protein n=1 Tax=Arundo donax TaxID=35708 RepID=A0A0A8Y0L5_ARUDO